MSIIVEILASLLLLIGAFFGVMGSVGLIRLPDFYCRLHAPTKASTLGVGAVLLAALILPLAVGRMPGLVELLLTLFVFISAPVAANMLSLAAFRLSGEDPGRGLEARDETAGAQDKA